MVLFLELSFNTETGQVIKNHQHAKPDSPPLSFIRWRIKNTHSRHLLWKKWILNFVENVFIKLLTKKLSSIRNSVILTLALVDLADNLQQIIKQKNSLRRKDETEIDHFWPTLNKRNISKFGRIEGKTSEIFLEN